MGKPKRKQTWNDKRENAKKPQPKEAYDQRGFIYENALFEGYYKVSDFILIHITTEIVIANIRK